MYADICVTSYYASSFSPLPYTWRVTTWTFPSISVNNHKRKFMENPEADIDKVVQLLTDPASPDIQEAAVRK